MADLTSRGRRANTPARLPALPASTATDPARRQWEEMVREWLEVRLGARGDFYERAVTHRELQEQIEQLQSDSTTTDVQQLLAQLAFLRGQISGLVSQISNLQTQVNSSITNSSTNSAIVTNISTTLRDVAVEDVAVFAVNMRPTFTDGCDPIETIEFTATQPNFHALPFLANVDTSADFHTMLPFAWAGKQFKVWVYWGHGASGTAWDVAWEVTANSTYDNESVNIDFEPGVLVTDTGGTPGNLYIALSEAIPIASYENEEGSMVSLRITRRGTFTEDTMDITAYLLAVRFTLEDIPLVAPTLDPLTLVQSRFVGASADDESYYNRGAPTVVGSGVVSSGKYTVSNNHAANPSAGQYLEYDFGVTSGDEVTFEFLCDWISTPNVNFMRMATVQWSASDGSTLCEFGYVGNLGAVCFSNQAFGLQYDSRPTTHTGKVHFALVMAVSGQRAYVNGVRVYELASNYSMGASTTARVRIGDTAGYTTGTTSFENYGFRVRKEELYTGASFTPPTEIPAP